MKMVDLVTQSVVGAVANDLLSLVRDAIKKSYNCKRYCKRLEKALEEIIPLLNEVIDTGSEEISQHRQNRLADFHKRLKDGTELVNSCSKVKRYNLYKSYKFATKIQALEKYIINFHPKQGWLHTMCDMQQLRESMKQGFETIQVEIAALELQQPRLMITDSMNQLQIDEEISSHIPQIPELPKSPVGLQISIDELWKRLSPEDVSHVAVKGLGGSGKTTLAIALCNDPKIKDHFKDRIVFETVSQSPNLRVTIERLWDKIVRGDRPDFHNVEDARILFQQGLNQMKPRPTLVVLDDVWKKHHLEKLLFKAEGYKTVITTRDSLVEAYCQYDLELLSEAGALSLFCFWAFGQKTVPETVDQNLVSQVIAECKGLPLGLKVIGSSLRDKPPAVWSHARNKLSQAEPISDYHKDGLLSCLKTSIDILEREVQECFLDLGIFPEDRKNPVAALSDLWVYVHELDWEAAYRNLIELNNRNLLSLVNSAMDHFGNMYGSSSELFIQHDVLRDLALTLARQEESINMRRRLIMPRGENYVPKIWKKHADSPFNAEIVSLHTGMMNEEDWCHMNFPRAKALVLNFSASEYFLPPFLQTMQQLKVLVIVNYNSERASLKGLSVLSSLSQLKSLRLERVIVPPLHDYCQTWQKLEKLLFSLCDCCEIMNWMQRSLCFNLPNLLELTIDHCSKLEELPACICNMTSLQKLSVTSCHILYKLSDDLGKLSSLQMLRLNGCPCLKELPYSICKLKQLKFLDISLCEHMQQLPDEFSQLSSLEGLDMRECSHVKKIPKSSSELKSLVHVICDEKLSLQWTAIKASNIPRLNVEVAEEPFHLDWLED
ncbi:hypothetical protein SUGI_0608130 [Cryptomeria japonica]|uniref:putative disease resistance protein At5g47280 n=1 Tax=Cryptomeria japonica TaxID=3369 RepID=UPI002414A392|nr:putative disease resistance protein At5g47280 [Cryptomeria japonica]GLJ30694.1 hypothetical protein SUGI_0608130 [Cryptomeria japonica]